MPMKPGTNEAIIEGTLYEKIVRDFADGAVAGEFVIEVPITVDGEEFNSLIPVSFYTKPKTKAGKDNVAYKGIKTIIDQAVSLQEANGDHTQADKIRLRNGTLGENMFFSSDDRFVSFGRVRGNFFDRVKETDFQPKAQFKVKMIVGNIQDEEVKEGEEVTITGRKIVTGQIVQYNGEIDEVKFIVQNKKHVDIIEKAWSINDTVNAQGIIKCITVEITTPVEEEDSFGEPMVSTQTRKLREFIITGGSGGAVEGYEEDDIAEARRSRKMRIAATKQKQEEKAKETQPSETAKSKVRDW